MYVAPGGGNPTKGNQMKELLQFLERATKCRYLEYAISIPTLTIKEKLDPAMSDFAKIKFWLAGYYQTLRLIQATGAQLTKEAIDDFNDVRAFLSQFDPKGGVATIKDQKDGQQ